MEKSFLEVLCNFYIVILAGLLPLYTEGGYWQLGDVKYTLFRNLSVLCLGLAFCGGLVETVERRRSRKDAEIPDEKGQTKRKRQQKRQAEAYGQTAGGKVQWKLSAMDICVLFYGGCVVASALCSSYGLTAWTGYREWYMGAFSQLLFVGIYFFISRQYKGASYPLYLWEGAFFLVMGAGLCNRLGMDPFGLMAGWNPGEWEYSHMLSTLGNINWFCGYCSVALAVPVAGYLKGKGRARCVWLYVVSLLGMLLLCIQGSDSGLGIAAVCLAVGLLWGQWEDVVFGRTILLAGGVSLSLPLYGNLAKMLGERAVLSLPADGIGISRISWNGWWIVGGLCLAWYVLGRKTAGKASGQGGSQREGRAVSCENREMGLMDKKGCGMVRCLWKRLPLGILICGGLAVILVYGGGLKADPGVDSSADSMQGVVTNLRWGNGRGGLWDLALQGFLQGDWKQKLLGAGPDCFADYIYGNFPAGEIIAAEGRWAGAVFANAHNQWLNHLVNLGLLGVTGAAGIAVTAIRRYRRYLPVILALAMYGINSLVSFQQVLSTPLLFLVLGMGESYIRNLEAGK